MPKIVLREGEHRDVREPEALSLAVLRPLPDFGYPRSVSPVYVHLTPEPRFHAWLPGSRMIGA
jgi:hypothetical protein